MSNAPILGGTAHRLPTDMHDALISDKKARAAWETLTPLSRNEWICWTISVKKEETRKEHVKRLTTELKEGKRRPCCWIGCIHRKDKPVSPSVQGILNRRTREEGRAL
ncbi:MAG TPA: YdeI/OmpD-associated family protein [Candidatus Paceibacterota bacterium]|nr:YdeI/OmpD-associated family protein [Candidatus Paceibacterota bacterium]